jgi:hypothetical protein
MAVLPSPDSAMDTPCAAFPTAPVPIVRLSESYDSGLCGGMKVWKSNGCVSFSNYNAFLTAYLSGEVTRLVVVDHPAVKTRESNQ